MPYELRLQGQAPVMFQTEAEAMLAVRHAVQANPDLVPEVFDTSTGRPCAPGASKEAREDYRKQVGF